MLRRGFNKGGQCIYIKGFRGFYSDLEKPYGLSLLKLRKDLERDGERGRQRAEKTARTPMERPREEIGKGLSRPRPLSS